MVAISGGGVGSVVISQADVHCYYRGFLPIDDNSSGRITFLST